MSTVTQIMAQAIAAIDEHRANLLFDTDLPDGVAADYLLDANDQLSLALRNIRRAQRELLEQQS